MRKSLSVLTVILIFAAAAYPQTAEPRAPGNTQDAIRAEQANAVHTTFAGTIKLAVDATDAPRKMFHSMLTIPVPAGATELTLVYPKWIPGEHGPTGPVADLAGLRFTAGGRTLSWRRDIVDMWAIHVQLPAGTREVEARLDYLSPAMASGFSSGASATAQMTVISWNQLLLYPQGTDATKVTFEASLSLPGSWRFGTALPVAGTENLGGASKVSFRAVDLETLVDSPVITGLNFRAIDITPPNEGLHHEIDIAADSPAALEMSEELQQHYKQLVAETGALFGTRHYGEYHFLLTLSDLSAHFGLEHHQSSDDRVGERALLDDNERKAMGALLPHEMTHSWNGKYRRPQDLATPNYQVPMEDDLLWVYEGLTEYLGDILAGRSGLWTAEQYRENLARVAAGLDHRPGRTWRPLLDTNVDAQHLYDASNAWSSWRRGVDFYDEGELIWLEVDTLIRKQSQNKRSIDDFTHLFHGGRSGPAVVPYTFDDVVNTLNQIAPYGWRKLLTERLTSLDAHAPMSGIQNAGWTLAYNDMPNEMVTAHESEGSADLSFSLGVMVNKEGAVVDSIVDMPAYRAGIGPGMTIVAVNGRRYTPDVIRDALRLGRNSKSPLELLIANGDYFRTVQIDYHDGNHYPHLVRMTNEQDLLSDIIKQHAPAVK
jgi:predicted metalloprotease with PDZ domain